MGEAGLGILMGRRKGSCPCELLALSPLHRRVIKPFEGRSSGFRISRVCRPSQPDWASGLGLQLVPGYSDGLAPDLHRLPTDLQASGPSPRRLSIRPLLCTSWHFLLLLLLRPFPPRPSGLVKDPRREFVEKS